MVNTAKQLPNDLQSWVDELLTVKIPVFSSTKQSLQRLSEEDAERSVDRFCSKILFDPGGVIAILSKANSRKSSMGTKVGSVENAAMMIGINAMRSLTDDYPTIDPPGETPSEKGFMRIVARSYHVAYQAYDWAVCRGDMVPKEVFVSAFLHDIGAMALWLYCPEKMKETHELKWTSMVPDDEAQYVVFGFSQEQVGLQLAEALNYPDLVVECLGTEDARNPRALCVKLARKMVHLSETGWYTEEMVECLESVASLLDLDYHEIVKRVHRNALDVAHETAFFEVQPSAALLPMTSCEWPSIHGGKREEQDGQHFCLMPQSYMYDSAVKSLAEFTKTDAEINDIIEIAMAGLHDGLGLNRVVFALLNKDKIRLEGKFIRGADSDPVFTQFAVDVDLGKKDLFTQLLQKPRSIRLGEQNGDKIWPLIPAKFKALVDTSEFYAMSVFVHGKPLGLFYADRHLKDINLDDKSYEKFKKISALVSKAIEANQEK